MSLTTQGLIDELERRGYRTLRANSWRLRNDFKVSPLGHQPLPVMEQSTERIERVARAIYESGLGDRLRFQTDLFLQAAKAVLDTLADPTTKEEQWKSSQPKPASPPTK